jgi:phosphohistidine phosphatase
MRIYLTQHGLAVPKDIDPDRPLSERGREDVRHLAEFLDKAGVRVGQVLHSGKTRAEQTAAILAEALLPERQPRAQAGLGPKDPLEKVSPETAFWSVDTLIAMVTLRRCYWGLAGRLHYLLVDLVGMALLGSLHYWNLLGFRF